MRFIVTTLLILVIAASNAFATEQARDKIIYEGTEYSLETNPMEEYFLKHPHRKPQTNVISSGLWRGYVATFEFENNDLILNDIEIQIRNEEKDDTSGLYPSTSWRSVMEDVIPSGEPLQIAWFTGILVMPHGDLVDFVHMGYGSTSSNYILLEIRGGKLTGVRKLDYNKYGQFREKQFQAFKNTVAYKDHVEKLKEEGWSLEDIDDFLHIFVIEYTSSFLDKEQLPDSSIDNDQE